MSTSIIISQDDLLNFASVSAKRTNVRTEYQEDVVLVTFNNNEIRVAYYIVYNNQVCLQIDSMRSLIPYVTQHATFFSVVN
jgi:hypothetical protein